MNEIGKQVKPVVLAIVAAVCVVAALILFSAKAWGKSEPTHTPSEPKQKPKPQPPAPASRAVDPLGAQPPPQREADSSGNGVEEA